MARCSQFPRVATCRTSPAWLGLACLLVAPAALPAPLVLWHSYRGAEEKALLAQLERARAAGVDIRPLAIPYEVFASKLTHAIPRGHGPDLFIYAHERIGGWASEGLLAPWGEAGELAGRFLLTAAQAVTYGERMWALPLAVKTLALFYDKRRVPQPPRTTDEMIALAGRLSDPAAGRFGLAWQTARFYDHHPWLAGFGGAVFADAPGERAVPGTGKISASPAMRRIVLDTPEARAALAFVRRLVEDRLVPAEASGALVTKLFNEGRAAMVVNGPWFLGEIAREVEYGVAVLPTVSETGRPAAPFLTCEALFVSAFSQDAEAARAAARLLALDTEGAVQRALEGRQVPALAAAAEDPRVAGDPILSVFRAQAERAVPMDSTQAMRLVWEPAELALRRVVRGAASPEEALRAAQARLAAVARPRPARAAAWPYLVGLALLGVAGLRWAARRWRAVGGPVSGSSRARLSPLAWLAPALLGMLVLIGVPFAWGAGLAFFHRTDDGYDFVGLGNFAAILSTADYPPTDPLSFWFTLAVTVLWTAVNVALHLALGLMLALLLDWPLGRLRPLYRVLLVLPWAVPSYITALVWKGMFDRQFGAINALLAALGVEPVFWFARFSTAFAANVAANTWLGFPFMMVVCLGALQSVPRDLYEAALVDGAGAWARFRHVTLPLIKPALVPALVLGSVWTFNMFNVVFLVSGGEPDGATDILVSEAYRWAFTRDAQYGYAAAYSLLIFAILLGWSALTRQAQESAEAAR